jgi:hypothetical protein
MQERLRQNQPKNVQKMGKLPASHRYNRLPLLLSNPGGIQQELVVQDLPGAKVQKKVIEQRKKRLCRESA